MSLFVIDISAIAEQEKRFYYYYLLFLVHQLTSLSFCNSFPPQYIPKIGKMKLSVFLVFLGVSMGLLSLLLDIANYYLFNLRDYCMSSFMDWLFFLFLCCFLFLFPFLKILSSLKRKRLCVFYVAWTVAFAYLAVLTTSFEPNAIGSGIPEMKSLLTGVLSLFPFSNSSTFSLTLLLLSPFLLNFFPGNILPRYLSVSVFLVKFGGLFFSLVAGNSPLDFLIWFATIIIIQF